MPKRTPEPNAEPRAQTSLSAFGDKAHRPEPEELPAVLGKSSGLWVELVARISDAHGPIVEEWGFPGAKYGWSLRLKRGDRVVVYMTPQHGRFLVGLTLGEKAAKAAHDDGAPEAVLALIDEAPRYPEGIGIRLPVAKRADVSIVRTLAALKMAAYPPAKTASRTRRA